MEQIDRSGGGGGRGGDWKRLAKEHICTYAKPMDTDSNVVKAGDRGRGMGAWAGERSRNGGYL